MKKKLDEAVTWQQKIQAQREYSEKNREVKRRYKTDKRTWREMQEKQPEKKTKLLCKLISHKETIDRPIVDNTGVCSPNGMVNLKNGVTTLQQYQ